MNQEKTTRKIKALGLCSGGLDSILSALVLREQGIDVTWICFETPFFGPRAAKKAAKMTGIPLITMDITTDYLKMLRAPKAGFGKNMNPCMDCHALMFEKAGELICSDGYDFLFSGEVLGQRPKSQNKNSLRYVEKNSRYDGKILRPLCARCLPETEMEKNGLVDRDKLLDITGRSRKVQMELAVKFKIKEFPSPAGGCLLTDKNYSIRLKDLMAHHETIEKRQLYYLSSGRHFRLDPDTKVIVGRSRFDNQKLMEHFDEKHDIRVRHASLPGPDVILTGTFSKKNMETAAGICAAYSKSEPGRSAEIKLVKNGEETVMRVETQKSDAFRSLMI